MDGLQFELLKHQHAFIFSDRKFPCLDGAFGNGKSTAGILKLGIHCITNPGTKVGFFRQDFTDIRRGSLEDWNEVWGDWGTYNSKSHYFTFEDSGSKVLFHQLTDKGKLKNHNLSAALIEQAEETTEEAFSYLVGRIRRSDTDNSNIRLQSPTGEEWTGSMADRWVGTLTNPEGHDWVWKLWIDEDLSDLAMNQGDALGLDDDMQMSSDDFHYIWADTFANIDNLPDDYLAGLQSLPNHLFERYVLGSRDSFEGQIYGMLDKDVHYIEPFEIPKQWNKYLLLDHGVRNPTAALKIAISPKDDVVVYWEHYKASGDEGQQWVISQHAQRILENMDNEQDPVTPYPEHMNNKWADPQIFQRTLQKGDQHYTINQEYQDQSDGRLSFAPWKKCSNNQDKQAQINRVAEYFMLNEAREHIVTGESPAPQMYIMKTCPNTWEEHVQYRWVDKARQMKSDEQNKKEKARNYKDHTCDCTGGFISMKRTGPTIKSSPPQGSFEERRKQLKKKKRKLNSGSSTPKIR